MKRKNPKYEIGKVFSKRLAEYRKAKGLTQREMAKKIGTSQRMIAYYESDACYVPLNLLPTICKVLKVTTDELFGLKKSQVLDSNHAVLWRRLKKAEGLSKRDQKALFEVLDGLFLKSKSKK